MSDLWETKREANRSAAKPLAARMRPKTLDEFAGQEHFLGAGKMLRRMMEADRLSSVIFYGPPGSGKTSLAEIIARHTKRHFERANAAAVGVKQVRAVLDSAKKRLENDAKGTIFFLDEIHRFNRAQQDILLGDVERGVITLIGATTENPYFSINSPLISRSQVFQFEPLGEEQIAKVLNRAIADKKRGFGELDIEIKDDALNKLAAMCDGDLRRALTALEIAVESQVAVGGGGGVNNDNPVSKNIEENQPSADSGRDARSTKPKERIYIDVEVIEQSIQQKQIVYDRAGDEHYDTISAFIKSMRGSDPDAAIYWLAKMLTAGEDPLFIARRIAILASEDIGNADPNALQMASSAYDITQRIGMPECQLTLGQAAIYMACAPKSNASAQAIWSAMSDVKNNRTQPVPKHLRDGHYGGAKKLGNAKGYKSAHESETGFVNQQYLGIEKQFYKPTQRGHEKRIGEFLEWIENQRGKSQEK